jgi:hypothetical protein
MQDYVIIFRVLMVAVALPLAGFDVDFDVAAYYPAVEAEDSIFEITAAVIAGSARENYMEPFAGIGHRVSYHMALPQTGDQPFRNLCIHILFTRLRV